MNISKTNFNSMIILRIKIWLNMRNFSLIVVIFILTNSFLFSQNNYNFIQFKDETFDYFNQPTKWKSNDWLRIGLIGASTFLLIQTDNQIRNEVIKDRSYFKSFPIEFGRHYGELYSPILISGIFGLNSLLTDNIKSKKIAFEIIQTTFYSGIITTGLKLALGRSRPFTEKGSKNFWNFSLFDDSKHSLPSGHTTIAFSISTVLANNSNSNLMKILCYIPAFLTATSRVYQDKHWVSDVFLGGIIGYSIGNWVKSKHEGLNLVGFSQQGRINFVINF